MDLDHLKDMNTAELSLGLFGIITVLNYFLSPKTVKRLRLDSIQRLLGFLANTKGGISPKKEID